MLRNAHLVRAFAMLGGLVILSDSVTHDTLIPAAAVGALRIPGCC